MLHHRLLICRIDRLTSARRIAQTIGSVPPVSKIRTCGAEVVRVNTATGATKVVWRVGLDQELRGATISPDGSLIAALAAPCGKQFFREHLIVHRLRDAATWTIGAGVTECHDIDLRGPHWRDSGHLVITYGGQASSPPHIDQDVYCAGVGAVRDSSLVVLDADRPARGIDGPMLHPDPSCSWNSAGIMNERIYVIQSCGSQSTNRSDGDVTLAEVDSKTMHVSRRWPLGRCGGGTVAADAHLGVLVSTTMGCKPSPAEQPNSATALYRLQSRHLRRIGPDGGPRWAHVSW